MRRWMMLLVCTGLAGCTAIRPAEMRLPSALIADSDMMAIDGIGGGTHGRYIVGDYRGGFERSEKRLAIFDAFVKNYGHSEFVIEGPAISTTIEARCKMRERVLDFGIAEFTPRPMAYRCDFTADGRSFPARFELQEIKEGLGGALSKRQRFGEIALGGEVIRMHSIHSLQSSGLKMASPIGYVLESDGVPVGAIELNGKPRLFVSRHIDQGTKRTLTIAAIALAIFWDPANSDLGGI